MKKLKKRLYKQKGYTLIEVVAVAIVIVTVGVTITGILSSLLRGGNKSKSTNAVSQNGNFAMSIISDTITSSDRVTKVNNNSDISGLCTSAPSAVQSISFRRFDGGETTILCDLTNKTIASVSADLTSFPIVNTSEVMLDTSVSPACYLKCFLTSNSLYSPPLIEVGFTLRDKRSSGFVETNTTQSFKTSILMRNYNPQQ